MSHTRVAITLDAQTLAKLDALVERGVFTNRNRGIEEAVQDMLERLRRNRLAEECAKLDPSFEQAMADETLKIPAESGAALG